MSLAAMDQLKDMSLNRVKATSITD